MSPWFNAYLAVGGAYLVVGAFRGLYRLDKHEETVLRRGATETCTTRSIPEFVVTVAITALAWPIFPAFWVITRVHGCTLRRRYRRNPPAWANPA